MIGTESLYAWHRGLAMIRRCGAEEQETIWSIINDGAEAYKGVIPPDRWSEPYMTRKKLHHEIESGVAFWGYEENGSLRGVLGLQPVDDVTLIRHAYVKTGDHRRGIGSALLRHAYQLTETPVLIGAWADAVWAIRFYESHDFACVSDAEKRRLLKNYWTIPDRQIETSVVLADRRWRSQAHSL